MTVPLLALLRHRVPLDLRSRVERDVVWESPRFDVGRLVRVSVGRGMLPM